jgi:hypothetical protein
MDLPQIGLLKAIKLQEIYFGENEHNINDMMSSWMRLKELSRLANNCRKGVTGLDDEEQKELTYTEPCGAACSVLTLELSGCWFESVSAFVVSVA